MRNNAKRQEYEAKMLFVDILLYSFWFCFALAHRSPSKFYKLAYNYHFPLILKKTSLYFTEEH